jgi:hypothetical protein
MSTIYYVKQLRLVSAEQAGKLGIPAESPAFVSPIIHEAMHCHSCRCIYTPLLYQTGYVTEAHHYHEADGGIYFRVPYQPRLRGSLREQTGWTAHVVPLDEGVTYQARDGRCGRAKAVRCEAITAWCMGNVPGVRRYGIGPPHGNHALTGGQIFAFPDAALASALLLPVCDEIMLPSSVVPFRFQIRDGTVYFQQRS